MTDRPGTQTRAFLFADLRGYSGFTERHGDAAARRLLAAYRELVRREIASHDGAEIRTEGDSFYVVFSSVAEAVLAGLAIRAAAAAEAVRPEGQPVRVGIGIHAGEARDDDQGIVSTAVNIAARVCAVAAPGEVLVTDTVRSLTRSTLDIHFAPRGVRRLKGIIEPIRLYRATQEPVGPPRLAGRRVGVATLVGGGAVLALVVGLALADGRQLGGVPTPTASSSDPPPSATIGAYPNRAESALLERLPERVAPSCSRADPDDAPVYEDVAYSQLGEFPLPVVAGLNCLTGLIRVVYWQSDADTGGFGGVDAVFFQEVGRLRLPSGECGVATRAWQHWESAVGSGNLLCYSASSSFLWWTYDDGSILAIASKRDGTIHELLGWWRDIGRLVSQ